MTISKFEHLKDLESPEAISKFLVGEVHKEHYPQVIAHFEGIMEKSDNKEVITEATKIVEKVNNIINLGDKKKKRKNKTILKMAA